ncbi:hypothetical protein KRX19_08405 [Cardiobacteriaceae bacterium TAE3-ERU3]|nr:hypothetical protein [Cardiobacteriaceae bacterium TAE3-ERU3]
MCKKIFRGAVLAVSLAVSSYGLAADQAPKNISDALNILVGAYNGAAKAAAENSGTTVETIDRKDLQPLENTLVRYQSELQKMVKADGEIDIRELGRFLNRLQSENQGSVSYDFAQALRALNGLSPGDNPQELLNQRVIDELVDAARSEELKQELGQAAPYLGALLQLGSQINDDLSQNVRENSAALSAQVQALKALAERYQAKPGLEQDVNVAAAQLKVLYADQALGKPFDEQAADNAIATLTQLEQRVITAEPHTLSTETYDNLLLPLAALGQPFTEQHRQWQELRAISLREAPRAPVSGGFDAPTRKLLDALNYDELPPHVQAELLKRLNVTTTE